MKKYTKKEIEKIAVDKFGRNYELFQGQLEWFTKGFNTALLIENLNTEGSKNNEIGILNKRIENLLRLDERWDTLSILEELTKASDILLHEKDYDGHGWELIAKATEEAKNLITIIKS